MAFNWERKGLFQSVFGVTRDEMKAELEQNGLNLVYSSATMSGNKILLPTATYNGTNLKTETLAKTNSEWTTAFNIQTQMKPYLAYTDASGNQKRAWLVRYATGATLCKGSTEAASFDKYKRLTNCEDIFVFNKDVRQLDMNEDNLKKKEPEKTHDNPTAWNLDDYVGEPFYEHGDVLVDEYGHRWFVVNQAGTPDVVGYQSETKGEKIPFAEVVCFEGFNYSADRKTATNLPSREEAIRGAFWLDLFFHQSTSVTNLKRGTKEYWIEKNKYAHLGSSVFNVLEYAGVEIRDLLQLISAQNGNPRQTSQAASIAYNDGSGRMRLLRYIANNQFSDNEFRYYLWDHYVSNPDATTLLYPDIAYSSVPIYLDDLTDKSKIIAYAEDSYVRQGQPDAEFPTNIGVPSRLPRTEVEPLAADASNCAYNIDRWRDRTFLADMWKAPILMFRITHIYDRGATDHALTAANGLMMVRIKKHEWEDNDGDDAELNYNQFRTMVFPAQYATCIKPGAWKLDGKDFEFPSWQSLYK